MPDQPCKLPELSLGDAIAKALQHIDNADMDLSRYTLVSANWSGHARLTGCCWVLLWMTAEQFEKSQLQPGRRGGGHLEVIVDAEGQVSQQLQR